MRNIFDWLSRQIVERRILVVLLILAISGVSVIGYVNADWLRFEPMKAVQSSSGENTEEYEPEPRVTPLSLSSSDAVLVVESDDFFNAEAVAALRKAVEELEKLDQVASVLWMDRVPILNIFGLPEPLLPRSKASEKRFEKAKEKAIAHPLVGGQLLSDDTKTLLMLVNLNYYHVLDDRQATIEIRDCAQDVLDAQASQEFRVRVTGRVPSALAAISTHESNQLKYQLFGYGMTALMAFVLFRGIRAVIIVALAPIFGVFWTLGMIRFLDYGNNPLVDVIVPVLISLVGLTDGVHLMVQIRKLRAQGLSNKEAARLGLRQVGLACFLTSLTTAIGFGSLVLADSEWVQQFGVCSMIGVLLCFIAVITIIPLACSSTLGKGIERGQETSLIDRNLGKIGGLIEWVLTHRKAVAWTGIASTLVLIAISMTLRPDQRQSDALPQSAESTQALFHVDRAFGGLEFSRIQVTWNSDIQSDSAEVLRVVTKVDDLLKREELIGHPLSIRNLIDAQPGSGPPEERMTLLELLPPPLKRAFYSPERRRAVINFRVQDLGIAAYGPVFERVELGLSEIMQQHPSFDLTLDGRAAWRWRNLYQIVVDLALSLGTATVIIWLVLTCVFRSMRLGFISLIPNLFPLALTGAYLAFAGYNLEIVMVCNFTVCLGIAVDDTIHFMTRYLDEQQSAPGESSQLVPIRRAFTGVGTALIMTTTVLVAGFSVVIFSDSRDHHIFATMGAITVAAALFCDLVFLPALLAVFDRKKHLDPSKPISEPRTS